MDITLILTTALVAALLVAGFTALLGLLIAVTDKIVNNYGEVTIDINDGKKVLKVNGGSKLLGTLAAEGIFIPSACGGRGSCGACKCQVLSDVGPHLPTEIPYLNDKEVKENVRLSCQVKVKTDLKLHIPEELFNIKKLDCIVEKIVPLTYDIKEVACRRGQTCTMWPATTVSLKYRPMATSRKRPRARTRSAATPSRRKPSSS